MAGNEFGNEGTVQWFPPPVLADKEGVGWSAI